MLCYSMIILYYAPSEHYPSDTSTAASQAGNVVPARRTRVVFGSRVRCVVARSCSHVAKYRFWCTRR